MCDRGNSTERGATYGYRGRAEEHVEGREAKKKGRAGALGSGARGPFLLSPGRGGRCTEK